MTEHHWFTEHLLEFASGQLDGEDARLVEEHLPQCDRCRAEFEAIAHDLQYLPMGAAPVPPRPGFNDRVLRAATGDTRTRPTMTPWAMTALAASTIIAAGLAWQGHDGAAAARADVAALHAELQTSRATAAALGDTLSIVRKASKVVYASLAMPGEQGGVVLFDDETTHRWQVVAHGLPQLPQGQRYQFWFVGEDGMLQGLPLVRSAVGSAMLTTGMPETPPGRLMGAAITIESDQGTATGAAHGPKVATLML